MALIPPAYFNTVVALGRPANDGTVRYTATGFLYGYPTGEVNQNGKAEYWVFLVTNRHVLENSSTGGSQLQARFNRPMGAQPQNYWVQTENPDGSPNWIAHPSANADVAVVQIHVQRLIEDGIEFAYFAGGTEAVLNLDQALEIGVSEGDGVFVLGFPLGEAGQDRNYTVVRQGIIARIQDWLSRNADSILIDSSIFPGNSGGPVLLKPEVASIRGTKSNDICRLIGIVASYVPYREYAVSEQTGRRRMIFEENSGLGNVMPYNLIVETVEHAVKVHNLRQPTATYAQDTVS